jgi:hypothetical protein
MVLTREKHRTWRSGACLRTYTIAVVDVEGLFAAHEAARKYQFIRVQRSLKCISEVSPGQSEVLGHFDRQWHHSSRHSQLLNRYGMEICAKHPRNASMTGSQSQIT